MSRTVGHEEEHVPQREAPLSEERLDLGTRRADGGQGVLTQLPVCDDELGRIAVRDMDAHVTTLRGTAVRTLEH